VKHVITFLMTSLTMQNKGTAHTSAHNTTIPTAKTVLTWNR